MSCVSYAPFESNYVSDTFTGSDGERYVVKTDGNMVSMAARGVMTRGMPCVLELGEPAFTLPPLSRTVTGHTSPAATFQEKAPPVDGVRRRRRLTPLARHGMPLLRSPLAGGPSLPLVHRSCLNAVGEDTEVSFKPFVEDADVKRLLERSPSPEPEQLVAETEPSEHTVAPRRGKRSRDADNDVLTAQLAKSMRLGDAA